MNARVGDHVLVKSSTVGRPPRGGEILKVLSADGTPPYLVRWSDTGHEALYYPGDDAEVRAARHAERR